MMKTQTTIIICQTGVRFSISVLVSSSGWQPKVSCRMGITTEQAINTVNRLYKLYLAVSDVTVCYATQNTCNVYKAKKKAVATANDNRLARTSIPKEVK